MGEARETSDEPGLQQAAGCQANKLLSECHWMEDRRVLGNPVYSELQ